MKQKNLESLLARVSLVIAIFSLVIGANTLQRVSRTTTIPEIGKLAREVSVAPVLAEGLCGFRPGYPTEGFEIPAGTEVDGPAILEPLSEDDDFIIAIYPEMSYITENAMKAWLYQGDTECLESQILYFPQSEVIRIKPEEYNIFLPLIMSPSNVYGPPEEEEGCGFREDGINVDIFEGDIVWGPAILVPTGQTEDDPDGYYYAIYPDKKFESPIRAQGWLYYGDSTCLESQFGGFPSNWEIIKITP